MYDDYYTMYQKVTQRLNFITEVSLVDEQLNEEYLQLVVIQNVLLKLIKITKDMK